MSEKYIIPKPNLRNVTEVVPVCQEAEVRFITQLCVVNYSFFSSLRMVNPATSEEITCQAIQKNSEFGEQTFLITNSKKYTYALASPPNLGYEVYLYDRWGYDVDESDPLPVILRSWNQTKSLSTRQQDELCKIINQNWLNKLYRPALEVLENATDLNMFNLLKKMLKHE